eukprot:g19538.t1
MALWRLCLLTLCVAEQLPDDECTTGTCSLELHQLRAQKEEAKLEVAKANVTTGSCSADDEAVSSAQSDSECWIEEFNEQFCCGDQWGNIQDSSIVRPEEDARWEKIKASKDLEDGGEYDFIVVGAGSAGSVVASRLADAATADGRPWRVLVLEATRREKEIHAQLQ